MKNSILNTVRNYKFAIATFTALFLAGGASAHAQTSYTSTTLTTAWNAARWNNSTDAATYGSTYTANNNVSFTSGSYSFTGMGSALNVGNITLGNNVTVNFTAGSTFGTAGNVRTINLGSGSIFDFNAQQISTAAGTGFIISGSGVFGTGTYTATANAQSFTINGGTVIARSTTGLGNGTSSVLNLNGGTVASNAGLSFGNTRFGGGIVIGGNMQFGELSANVTLAESTANLSFANNVSLGSVVRTFTLGNNGVQTFSGIISNSSGGITFSANSGLTGTGRFDITGTANTFIGPININAGEARFTADGSFGNSANTIVIDGGRLATADAATYTITASRGIAVGDGAGASISTTGAGTLTYNGVIANKTGEIGSWAKQGAGTLVLGGVSTYTGNTAIEAGLLQLTGGNDRLPTGTVVSLGSTGTTLGTLDLNGQNQQIAGLVSTTGTVASGSIKNTVTSTTAATLEINVAEGTTKSYGGGTTQNSGVIGGFLGLTKSGLGTQVLGDANTYSGTTTVNAGTLAVNGSITSSSAVVNGGLLNVNGTAASVTVNRGGSLGGSGTVGAVTLANGSFLKPGNSPGLLIAVSSSWAAGSTYQWEIDNATGKAGTNWDLFSVTGALDMSALSSGSKMNLVLESLSVANYSTATSFSWVIAQAGSFTGTGLADGTNVTDLFNINATAFNGGNLPTNGFKVEVGTSGSLRTLNLMAIPEPSTGALLGFGLGGLVITRLLRRKQS